MNKNNEIGVVQDVAKKYADLVQQNKLTQRVIMTGAWSINYDLSFNLSSVNIVILVKSLIDRTQEVQTE